MEKKWYIINVQTGCESTAKTAIEERIKSNKMEAQFGDILIPAESVVELVKGQKTTKSRKFFPGYIFVNMVLSDQTWHLVKNSSKVSGFVGAGTGGAKTRPPEVPEAEVMRVTQQMAGLAEKPKAKANFSVGEQVTVVDGPFSNFNGTVEDINEEKAKVKVLVSIFGRPTPVELDFIQVEKN
ncbi:transcription termination/antitermination protein NusG [Pseudobdellovibrio exovorus]|uniref:Transcription termination/antitermination protein NusG n=1 Tax=Pseudobdellovibrio exovorus JSS TaxID=1184267 RepID=M4VA94_9BACT|nr:transcription termination/antitermination protein NusG [Pseudobdellovibrio exovorus]AGH96138.1 transcription antitermination protein [Pseudobdellovibrio exovorus JSS]